MCINVVSCYWSMPNIVHALQSELVLCAIQPEPIVCVIQPEPIVCYPAWIFCVLSTLYHCVCYPAWTHCACYSAWTHCVCYSVWTHCVCYPAWTGCVFSSVNSRRTLILCKQCWRKKSMRWNLLLMSCLTRAHSTEFLILLWVTYSGTSLSPANFNSDFY